MAHTMVTGIARANAWHKLEPYMAASKREAKDMWEPGPTSGAAMMKNERFMTFIIPVVYEMYCRYMRTLDAAAASAGQQLKLPAQPCKDWIDQAIYMMLMARDMEKLDNGPLITLVNKAREKNPELFKPFPPGLGAKEMVERHGEFYREKYCRLVLPITVEMFKRCEQELLSLSAPPSSASSK